MREHVVAQPLAEKDIYHRSADRPAFSGGGLYEPARKISPGIYLFIAINSCTRSLISFLDFTSNSISDAVSGRGPE